MDSTKTVITKESKNKIRVDYEGKLTFKERMKKKLQSSHTWIKAVVAVLKFILMLGVSYVILFPFFSKIAGSFMGKLDVVDPTVSLIPKHFTLDIYKYIIIDNFYFKAFFNTLLLSIICALIQTFVACLIGYGLAKFKFKGNKWVMIGVIITMLIPHNTLKVSMMYRFTNFDIFGIRMFGDGILTSLFGQIDLNNTMTPYIILSLGGLAFKNGLYIYMMRQFFKGVPDELEESAYVDGSNTFRTFLQIILPLSIPMMITIFIFSFSWQWTDQFYAGLFSAGSAEDYLWTMVNVVQDPVTPLIDTAFAGNSLYIGLVTDTAGIMVIIPLVIMYLFCQKYIVQGIERSGITG